MTTDAATLRRWRPHSWTRQDKTAEAFDTTGKADDEPVLVAMDDMMEKRDLAALYRAFERNRLARRLFHPEPALEGTPWYDGLERIVGMSIEYRTGDQTFTLECPRADPDSDAVRTAGNQACADAIKVRAVLRRKEATRTLELETDFAVADEYEPSPTAAGIVVTGDTTLGIEELTELIHDAVFEPGGEHDDDAIETQLEDAREDAHYAACRLLVDHATAEAERIGYAVQHRIAHLIPDGHTVQIIKHPGQDSVQVDVWEK